MRMFVMSDKFNRRTLLQWSCASSISLLGSCSQNPSPLEGAKHSGTNKSDNVSDPVTKPATTSAMRITDLRAFQPATPGSPPDWRTQLGQIVIEVHTDAGLVGTGVGGGGAASIHLVHTVLRDLLLGKDATQVEELYREMYRHTLFYGRKGLVIMATSGVDLALWDLRGKQTGQPIARLLNPKVDLSARIPTYTTVFTEKDTATAIAEGHHSIKLHLERFGEHPDIAKIAEFVRGVREQVGPDKPLMIDAYGCWDIDTALRAADAIQPYNITFLEEPLPPDDLDGYEALVKKCPIPIAGGEHEYTEKGFKELIDRRLHAVLQPDINWCGGLTTVIEVYRMAKAAGLQVCLHRGCEPFALHTLAALDDKPLAESPRTWFKCLKGAPEIEQGEIQLTDVPGFGVSVDREK
jgi:L-rhamnonate dehydratase